MRVIQPAPREGVFELPVDEFDATVVPFLQNVLQELASTRSISTTSIQGLQLPLFVRVVRVRLLTLQMGH